MTRERRQRLKIVCLAVLPAAALAVDAWFFVSMQAWTYNLIKNGPDVFWPAVVALGLLFFPLAALFFGSDLFQFLSTAESARWPIAEGRVTGGRIEDVEVSRGKSAILYDIEYRPVVTYAYEVAGTTCSNDIPANRLKSREEAEGELRAYPVGATVLVHYDQDDPTTSVLETGDGSAFRSFGGTLFFAALPFVIVSLIIAFG